MCRRRGDCHFERFKAVSWIERYRKDVVSFLRLDNILERVNPAYGKTVWTVWSMSFDRIKTKDPLAPDLLRSIYSPFGQHISHHHPQDILGLVDLFPARSVDVALNRQRNFSLIYRTIRSDARDGGCTDGRGQDYTI